jgi:hypothetical protein
MEPTNPNDTNTPQQYNTYGSTAPDNKPRFSRKKLLVMAVIALLVIFGIAVALANGGKKDDGTNKPTGNVYYDRPGFERSKLGDAIGDPAPLITKSGAAAVSYKGSPVVQACNLLTVEELRKQGLQLSPNSLTAFERTYFDGQSQGTLNTFSSSLASMGDTNDCTYPLDDDNGTMSIDVYQPAYNQPSAITYELRQYTANGSVAGLARYERTFEDSTYYLLRDGDSAIQIQLRKVSDKAVAEKLLSKVAENYTHEKGAPAGPVQFTYSSPVFNKTYLNGCSLITANDVTQLFDSEASPLVTERAATATGVTYYTQQKNPTYYSRIEHACVRQAVSDGFSDRKSLTAETTSFTTDEAAKLEMQSGRRLDADVISVSTKIGDDVYFSNTTGNNPEMVIRKGRFVVNLSMYDQTKSRMTQRDQVQRLTPIAQSLVARIKD